MKKIIVHQPCMLELRQQIFEAIKNGPDVGMDCHFEELLLALYEDGMCGLNFSDVMETIRNRHGKLIKVSVGQLGDLQGLINIHIREKRVNVVFVVKFPHIYDLDDLNKVAEWVMDRVHKNSRVEWQGHHTNRNEVILLLLLLYS